MNILNDSYSENNIFTFQVLISGVIQQYLFYNYFKKKLKRENTIKYKKLFLEQFECRGQ
jgi:hypothetical protein